MDPQTLPPEEKALYEAIKRQYKVAFEKLKIGEHTLHLLKMTDLEQVLAGKDPLADVASFPFWVRLWEADFVLAECMAAAPLAPESTVLELRAGLGVPGLLVAARGYRVTLTDFDQIILDFERINAAASKVGDRVRVARLDWLNPPEMERYDVILGSEILFREEFFAPLLALMRSALKPGGTVYLAHDIQRRSVQPFLQMAEPHFRIAASRRRLKSLTGDKTVLLARLQARD
ncbi:MAG: class I SAM-dependent methyltransferase [Desulfobulbus sp.]|jgi:predicted nicotinamide N-methyase